MAAAFGFSNQLKITWEISASKFQRQHATQFNFCRYEGLCPATKPEIHWDVSKGILWNLGISRINKTQDFSNLPFCVQDIVFLFFFASSWFLIKKNVIVLSNVF